MKKTKNTTTLERLKTAWLTAESAQNAGQYAVAEQWFEKVLLMKPPFLAEAYVNLATVQSAQNKIELAAQNYRQALSIAPQRMEMHYNFAVFLHKYFEYEQAATHYGEALKIQPTHRQSLNNLGLVYTELKRYDDAEQCFRQIVDIKVDAHEQPNYAIYLCNLGHLYRKMRRIHDATLCYRYVLQNYPQDEQALDNLAGLLYGEKQWGEALALYQQVLGLNPNSGAAAGKVMCLSYRLCEWAHVPQARQHVEMILSTAQSSGMNPFDILAAEHLNAAHQKKSGKLYAAHTYPQALATQPLKNSADAKPKNRLRIGYLSADFHEHPVMQLLIGILEQHDKSKFSIYAYSCGPDTDHPYRERARLACDKFTDIRHLTDAAAAQLIVDDEVDILVEMMGYTSNTRLGIAIAHPAPVVMSWLGYPATVGHPRVSDWLIGDAVLTPLEHAEHFSETLALMPHSYQPNSRYAPIEPMSRQQAGLPDDGLVFCCFNQTLKFNPSTFDLWARVLTQVPNAYLWLFSGNEVAQQHIKNELSARGFSTERVIFAPRLPLNEHLSRLAKADIALDSYPYTSGATASNALWAGVPLVTKIGETLVSRLAASVLSGAGLGELIVQSDDAYVDLVLSLAHDRSAYQALRQKINDVKTQSALFDDALFTQNLQQLYQTVWQQTCDGRREGFLVQFP